MSDGGGLGTLDSSQWRRLTAIIDRFEEAWGRVVGTQEPPDLAAFLPQADDPIRAPLLRELIKTDLEIRWKTGRPIFLESYLERFPELGPPAAPPPRLVQEEYRVRQLWGDRPPASDYRRRFPGLPSSAEGLLRDPTVSPGGGPAVTPFSPLRTPAAGGRPGSEPVVPTEGYRRVRRLGMGTFGEVWEVEAPGGFAAAMKVILRPIDHGDAQQELHSLELMRRLRHPSLVQTQAYWVLEDRLVIVMELADGTLRDRLRQCRDDGLSGIPAKELISYFRFAAEGLDYLHEQNVQHRDVKPDNILLFKNHAKVADFGLARVHQTLRSATATGTGTPAYMAPEVWRDRLHPTSDLYSLALSYAELRTGSRPIRGQSLQEIMLAQLEEEPDLIGLPGPEQAVLQRALSKDPDQRHATCAEFVTELEKALLPPPAPTPPASQKVVKWSDDKEDIARGPWVFLLGAGAALGAVILGVLLWYLSRPGKVAIVRSEEGPKFILNSGEPFLVPLTVRRDGARGEIKIHCDNPDDDVFFEDLTIPAGENKGELRVTARPSASAGKKELGFHVDGPSLSGDSYFSVDIVRLFLPDGFSGKGPIKRDDAGNFYYDRLVRHVDGVPRDVEFVLVEKDHTAFNPPIEGDQDISTFYIMQYKVWRRLFRAFAEKENRASQFGWKAEEDDWPLLGASAEDARRFARWLAPGADADLPTAEQWQKAAGYYLPVRTDRDGPDGPFQAPANKGKLRVAVRLKHPVPVDADDQDGDDVSRYGCRGMAGNGEEWTCTGAGQGASRREPLFTKDTQLMARGKDFAAHSPFPFGAIPGYLYPTYKAASPERPVGFRVVLNPK